MPLIFTLHWWPLEFFILSQNFHVVLPKKMSPLFLSLALDLCRPFSLNKATGLDNISCRLLKEAGPIIATSLACIINKTVDTGLFPSLWKMAKVFPLLSYFEKIAHMSVA